ncbi:MAG: hypothetical protein ABIS20_01575 [Thermoanaerobaculia bacterium]
MGAPILIAVGGSGQHTMLAYLRLARLCNLVPARLMTIDADLRQGEGGQPTTASLIERQARIGFREKVAWEPVRPLPEVNDTQAQTFESLLRPAPGVETDVFSALFNPRQREVKVVTGFHGHPSVAASTFRMFMNDGAAGLSKLFNEWLSPEGEQRIVVAGSTFGGTGSGVMPVLTSFIKDWCKQRDRQLRLGGVIQVRWFDLGLPDQVMPEDQEKVDVTSHDLERNSSCLVEYYRRNLESMFHNAFLLGHFPHASRRSTGVEQQPEHPHAVNLLAGYVAYQLLHEEEHADTKGLLGLVTPDGSLEQHLHLPFGRSRKPQPLARHIEATGAEIALNQAILNVLSAGPASSLDVVEPYPLFFSELVRQSQGSFSGPDGRRTEPASSWNEFFNMQKEAMRWLAAVRENSFDIQACQFPESLVPPDRDVGKLLIHAPHLLGPLHDAFRRILKKVQPIEYGDDPEAVIRRSFYTIRQELENYLEDKLRRTQ